MTEPDEGILSVVVFFPAISVSFIHPDVCCFKTIPDLDACAGLVPDAAVNVTPFAVSLVSANNAAEHSAYALLMLAISVASLAFSS